MKFTADRWVGNQWPSIDIEPVDSAYFLPLLLYLATTYRFPMPPVTMHLDPWTFSVAFENHAARDQVLANLQQLPSDYF